MIWQLQLDLDRYLYVQPDPLADYIDMFSGAPMSKKWRRPKLRVFNDAAPTPDFMGFCLGAPAVSEKARSIIQKLDRIKAEFLELPKVKGEKFWLLNVVSKIDVLDVSKSNLSAGSERYIFKDFDPTDMPPLFKVPDVDSEIFATATFGNTMIKHQLRGVALADPSKSVFRSILLGEEINAFEGLKP